MLLPPSWLVGRSVIKSIVTHCQGAYGIPRGYNVPGYLPLSGLIRAQTSHALMYSYTWYASLGK